MRTSVDALPDMQTECQPVRSYRTVTELTAHYHITTHFTQRAAYRAARAQDFIKLSAVSPNPNTVEWV
jgi:hypothetical protein